MRILALDPGTSATAYIVFDGQHAHAKGWLPNADMMALIKSRDLEPYDSAAIEMIASYGLPVGKEVFETCLWIGRFMERIPQPTQLVYRKDVKLHLCNSPRAKDGNVRQALVDKYGAPGTKKSPGMLYGVSKHIWAALAVADYALSTSPRL